MREMATRYLKKLRHEAALKRARDAEARSAPEVDDGGI
jgi:hypothetical protein